MKKGLIPVEPTEDFFLQCAKDLRAVVKQNQAPKSRSSVAEWAAQIQKIHTVNKTPRKIIRRVLDFYLANFGRQYIPVAYSGAGFREKFARIRSAMDRVPPEKIRVTDTAREIQRACGYLIWPGKKEAAAELEFIQLSYDRYEMFISNLQLAWMSAHKKAELEEARQIAETGSFKSTVWEFARLLERIYLTAPDPVEYICDWARHVHLMAYEWDAWHGDLLRAAWRRDSKSFVRAMRAAVAAYSGDPADWDRIVAALDS